MSRGYWTGRRATVLTAFGNHGGQSGWGARMDSTALVVKLSAVKGTVPAPLFVGGAGAPGGDVAPRPEEEVATEESVHGRERLSLAVHVTTLFLAFAFWAYLDRNLWFFGDEWDFLTRRGLHGATFSIWAPHNEHWSVLPILLWRAVFSVAHLSTYWPYLVPLLLVHVAVVHLVWRRCLLEGADIWVANGLALLFALFGTGAEDLAWAFQIGFVGSIALGLLALDLADSSARAASKAPPASRGREAALRPLLDGWLSDKPALRDCLVALLALAAMMCSDIGVAVTVALAFVMLARHGWRHALGALALPVLAYAIWFGLAGRSGLAATGDTFNASVFSKVPTFVATNLEMDLSHTAGWPAARYELFAAVAAWALWNVLSLAREHPAVLGEVVAAVAFYAMAALGRDRISATLSPSRYAYIGTALMLPAISLMLTSLPGVLSRLGGWLAAGGRGRDEAALSSRVAAVSSVVVLLVVLASTSANIVDGFQFVRSRTVFVRDLKNQILTSSVLLQNAGQMARAINHYPVWASGFAAGYLTPWELAALYRQGFIRSPGSLMTVAQVRRDESWLDLTAQHRRSFFGKFRLLSLPSNDLAVGRPLRAPGWPVGPGSCALSSLPGTRAAGATLKFASFGNARTAALWISLGRRGGRVHFYLREAWGFRGPSGSGPVTGETVQVQADGYLWLNDSVPSTGLGLSVPAGLRAEICGLASTARRTGRPRSRHPHQNADAITA